MFKLKSWLAAALAVIVHSTAHAAPLEAYGRLPFIEIIKVSPDGTKLVIGASNAEQRTLMVRDLTDGSTQSYPIGDTKVRGLEWFGSDHVIVTVSRTGTIPNLSTPRSEFAMASDLDIKRRKFEPLLQFTPGGPKTGTNIRPADTGKVDGSLNVLVATPEIRTIAGKPTLFLTGISFPSDRGVVTVFRHDPISLVPRIAALGREDTDEFILDAEGKAIGEATYEPKSGRWALRLGEGSLRKEVKVVQALNERPQVIGLGRDGRSVVIAEFAEQGSLVREVALDGTFSEPLDIADADGALFDPQTHRLIGTTALIGDEYRHTFFAAADQKSWNAVRAAFKADPVRLVSWSSDRRKIIVLVDSSIEGPSYFFVDLDKHSAIWIAARYPEVPPAEIAKVQPIRYKAADGLELSGYLTLPQGVEPKNLPLVVFPHGGPASRDTPGFDWWAQAMVSRGYAVLQVNFRGSDGYGWQHLAAGFGEWGRKMQTDLSDGVRHLQAQGVIDPKRVCIVGASYGGYAALAGATLDPSVYRCAVSVAGLSDLKSFVSWVRNTRGNVAGERYWERFMGAENQRDPSLTQVSPITHAQRVSAPILLIHGRDDTVVPLSQSQAMANALRRAGKPAELVVLKGEDHWLSTGETRLEMLQAAVAFLEKNNPPH